PNSELAHRIEPRRAQRAPQPQLEPRLGRTTGAPLVEHAAQARGTGSTFAIQGSETRLHLGRRRDPTMQRIFEHRLELVDLEHAGNVDERARRAGHRYPVDPATIVRSDRAAMHHDARAPQTSARGNPELDRCELIGGAVETAKRPEPRRRAVR